MITEGKIDAKLFSSEKRVFDSAFSLGIKTPIEEVKNNKDRFYHIIARHSDEMMYKGVANEITSVVKNPSQIYMSKDRLGIKANAYYDEYKNILVIVREDGIITAYKPKETYINKLIKRSEKLYGK